MMLDESVVNLIRFASVGERFGHEIPHLKIEMGAPDLWAPGFSWYPILHDETVKDGVPGVCWPLFADRLIADRLLAIQK